MESDYQTIAQALIATCPPGFEEARVIAEIDQDWSNIQYECRVDGQEKTGLKGDTLTSSKVDDALYNLRTNWPGDPWSRCTFTLFPDGKFKFDVAHDD